MMMKLQAGFTFPYPDKKLYMNSLSYNKPCLLFTDRVFDGDGKI